MDNAQVLDGIQDSSVVNKQPGWKFWIWWVLLSVAGSGVTVIITGYRSGATFGHLEIAVLREWMLAGLVIGAAIGVAQWFVLRRYLTRALWWIPATCIGWAVGMGVFILAQTYLLIRLDPEQWTIVDIIFKSLGLITEAEDNYLAYYLHAALLCGSVSLVQLVALSGNVERKALLIWILAGSLSGLVLFRVVDLAIRLPLSGLAQQISEYILPFGAMHAVTGASVVYVLRNLTRPAMLANR